MNVVRKVTLQTLKKSRRRTIVTILGTAVAVAMVTAVAVLLASVADLAKRYVISEEGEWHYQFSGLAKEELPALAAYGNTRYMDVYQNQDFMKLPGQEEKSKETLSVRAYTAESFPREPFTVTEGRLPERPGELFLSEHFREYGGQGWEVGQSVTLPGGYFVRTGAGGAVLEELHAPAGTRQQNMEWREQGTRTFTVVGYGNLQYAENRYSASFTGLTVLDEGAGDAWGAPYTARLTLKKTGRSVFEDGSALYDNLFGEYSSVELRFNHTLLSMGGNFRSLLMERSFLLFFGILFLIIIIGGVALIRNAFSISLTERVRALGMLAGVGATRRQKRASVFYEAMFIALFAIPLGILGGVGGIAVVLALVGKTMTGLLFNSDLGMRAVVPLWVVLFTVVFSAFLLLFSAWKPARRASKVAPVEAMRGGGGKEGKIRRVRSGRLAQRLFGFEAALGIKNSKRNRKRYRSILSSLAVSLILFLAVASAMHFVREGAGFVVDNTPYDVQGQMYTYSGELMERDDIRRVFEDVRGMPGVDEADVFLQQYAAAMIPAELVNKELRAAYEPDMGNAYGMGVEVTALDDESFQRYCRQANISPDIMEGDGPAAILLGPLEYPIGTDKLVRRHTTSLAEGDELVLMIPVYDADGEESMVMEQFRIAAVSEQFPGMVRPTGMMQMMKVVVRLSDVHLLLDANPVLSESINRYEYAARCTDADLFYKTVEMYQPTGGVRLYSYSLVEERQLNRSIIFLISVFTYGFVALITLVCVANIFNTVSTGIALRTREFAMLRSTGLTTKGFNRMMNCEALHYSLMAVLWGIPISLLLAKLLHRVFSDGFWFPFTLPWGAYVGGAVGVVAVMFLSMMSSRRKVKHANIVETLKQENW